MPNLNDIMEMMDALETKAIITIPTFCVAVRNRHSSCRKCVDACLADAITIEKNGKTCDMRKLMAVMGMGIRQGETITVTAEGEDEAAAIEAVEKFLTENV